MAAQAAHTPGTVLENIQAIIRLEEEQERDRRWSDRVADAIGSFAGTVGFVLLHLGWFVLWAAMGAGAVPYVSPFDPYPFQLLAMIVSLEGVLLSTFVLIKQNRMGKRSERRNHLDLQINLLTEKEVTKVIQMLEAITAHLGIAQADPEAREMAHETAVDDLARELKRIPEDK